MDRHALINMPLAYIRVRCCCWCCWSNTPVWYCILIIIMTYTVCQSQRLRYALSVAQADLPSDSVNHRGPSYFCQSLNLVSILQYRVAWSSFSQSLNHILILSVGVRGLYFVTSWSLFSISCCQSWEMMNILSTTAAEAYSPLVTVSHRRWWTFCQPQRLKPILH